MKVLVTGGAGYVGSHCVEELVKNGFEVVVFDNLSLGHIEAVPKEAVFIKGDLANKKAIEQVFNEHKFDGVLHFAARSLVGESMQDPFLYLGNNVINALNLLAVMIKNNVNKFILSSTANLFDEPKTIPIDESAAIIPGSPYGESKHIIERYLYWLDRIFGFRYTSLRYFNAAGASPSGERGEDHKPETHLIPIVISTALGRRDKVLVFGNDYATRDGSCIRDYIHVSDLATAHILSLRSLTKKSMVYNLGSGSGYSVFEVISEVEKVVGKKVRYEVGPRRLGDPVQLVASSSKIKKELGWKPKYGLEEIVETAYKWHKNNPRGFA
ncbi:UDP-glucose 4-epimerase GalE [Candidatus Woesebacteria bacterium RIFCSPLOWO2_02_FULL_42_10]|nr:MAG: UDP-glucose 4-epimerase GalE [Candidatus Woesebacteria bacterium RIFCSPLOWO2_02_FULL_42_10]